MPANSVAGAVMPRRAAIPLAAAAGAGIALWFAASLISGQREAWDAGLYWSAAYPAAIVLSGVFGFRYPQRPWRWPVVMFFGQFVGMLLRNGELGSLWPLGLLLFGALAVPGILAARIAAWLRIRQSGGAP